MENQQYMNGKKYIRLNSIDTYAKLILDFTNKCREIDVTDATKKEKEESIRDLAYQIRNLTEQLKSYADSFAWLNRKIGF